MTSIFDWLARVLAQWKIWLVIAPWDVGVRVRLGKTASSLGPGWHFRIPFVDEILLVNTRLRMIAAPPVTLRSGRMCRVLRATAGVRVVDPLRAMMEFSRIESIVAVRLQSLLAEATSSDECRARLQKMFDPSMIVIELVCYVDDAEARPLRLINDGWTVPTNDTDEKRLMRY